MLFRSPPKKYQDIYPVNFDNDPEGIRAEVLRVVRHWIAQGVTIFRVDNPHTKPLQFWEWLIATVNAEHPDVVFLAEAFTRPAPLQALAQIGFQQSYSYFTWRMATMAHKNGRQRLALLLLKLYVYVKSEKVKEHLLSNL